MSKAEFFHGTPNDIYLYLTQYDKKAKAEAEAEFKKMEYSAWTAGLYVRQAVASVLSKRAKYPKQPYGVEQQDKIVVTEDMTEQQKIEITNLLFGNLQEMQEKFEAHQAQSR